MSNTLTIVNLEQLKHLFHIQAAIIEAENKLQEEKNLFPGLVDTPLKGLKDTLHIIETSVAALYDGEKDRPVDFIFEDLKKTEPLSRTFITAAISMLYEKHIKNAPAE